MLAEKSSLYALVPLAAIVSPVVALIAMSALAEFFRSYCSRLIGLAAPLMKRLLPVWFWPPLNLTVGAAVNVDVQLTSKEAAAVFSVKRSAKEPKAAVTAVALAVQVGAMVAVTVMVAVVEVADCAWAPVVTAARSRAE